MFYDASAAKVISAMTPTVTIGGISGELPDPENEPYGLCDFSPVHEKPINCGTKATGVLANFWPANFNAGLLKYFGAFATNITSQRLSIQSIAPSATVWPQFQC